VNSLAKPKIQDGTGVLESPSQMCKNRQNRVSAIFTIFPERSGQRREAKSAKSTA
jgi:hypothetical protein